MSEDTSGAVIALALVGVFTVACMCMMLSGDYTYFVDGTELSTLDDVNQRRTNHAYKLPTLHSMR